MEWRGGEGGGGGWGWWRGGGHSIWFTSFLLDLLRRCRISLVIGVEYGRRGSGSGLQVTSGDVEKSRCKVGSVDFCEGTSINHVNGLWRTYRPEMLQLTETSSGQH